jgi:hypothetical protein
MDITLPELIKAIEDENLKTWWENINFPEDFTMNEFLVKILEAASIAAAVKNETLEPGKKILGYPPATNGAIARMGNQIFFPRTSTVVSRVVTTLDNATPVIG